jgi:NADH:ubiquinone oxidoreductase subunit F (NADH-binding)
MGVHWLADQHHRLPAGVARALRTVADALEATARFLRQALTMLETVVDVVVDTSIRVVRRVVRANRVKDSESCRWGTRCSELGGAWLSR